MTAFFALFIFTGIFNSFNARTHRVNLFAHIHRNPGFVGIMAMVAVIQLVLIYYGGQPLPHGRADSQESCSSSW